MKFKRFTKPEFLKQVGRELLGKLFGRFSEELAARKVEMPAPDLENDAYFRALASISMAPDVLPDSLIETLFAIEEMANEHGQERLETAATQTGLRLELAEESSHGDIAVQVWLAKPELLIEKHNELRLSRLAAFEYYGSKAPVDRSGGFNVPGQPALDLLTADLDAWCKAHSRGDETVHIEVYLMEDESWFLIRHGDTFERKMTVDGRKILVRHYRPAKDDVVVYSPLRDELRIHAGTKGERDLYRTAFGARLFGEADYFGERLAYTLDPLREDGEAALDTDGIENVDRIVLVELEVAYGGECREQVIRKAADLFAAAKARAREGVSPGGRLVRAGFDVYFRGVAKPRKVQVRPPNVLKLGRHCDAVAVHHWLSARGFRANTH